MTQCIHVSSRLVVDHWIASIGGVREKPQLKPSRQLWMEVVFLNDDVIVTKTNGDEYTIRTKLYQYWNPASETGWIYVDGM